MDKLTPAMQRAMDKLTGTVKGRLRKGDGVAIQTARALHRRGLAYLEGDNTSWDLVLIELEVREITDQQLGEALIEKRGMTLDEADMLRPLAPADRYRALRHAHIARETYGKGELAVQYGDAGHSRAAVLSNRVRVVLQWKTGKISDREYSNHRNLAGEQFKSARSYVTDVWYIGTGFGEAVLTVQAVDGHTARAAADKAIAADPVGYADLVKGYGTRRLTLGDLVADRRAGKTTF